MISGDWLIALAVTGIPAVIIAWKKGVSKGQTNKVTLPDPMPEVPVKRVYSPPSFSQHMDLVRRIEVMESNVADLRRDQAQQFLRLMEVGEKRKDDILEKFETVARGFHSRVDQLILEKRKEGA